MRNRPGKAILFHRFILHTILLVSGQIRLRFFPIQKKCDNIIAIMLPFIFLQGQTGIQGFFGKHHKTVEKVQFCVKYGGGFRGKWGYITGIRRPFMLTYR